MTDLTRALADALAAEGIDADHGEPDLTAMANRILRRVPQLGVCLDDPEATVADGWCNHPDYRHRYGPPEGDGPCSVTAPHGPHRWDREDRVHLRWECPGVNHKEES